MEVKLAKTAGFCFGVKRAVDTVYKEAEKNSERIYTFGPIIHNEQVVEDLEKNGVFVVNTIEELKSLKSGTTVIVRSHGVGKGIYDLMEERGLKIVDATCPFVKKIHRIAERESKAGKRIIIIGNDKHPEVEGIKGWASSNVSMTVACPHTHPLIPSTSGCLSFPMMIMRFPDLLSRSAIL